MRVYVHPYSRRPGRPPNRYTERFIESLAPHCQVVNRERPTAAGLFGVLRHLGRLDVLVLHWIEDLPDKRGGTMQVALLHLLLRLRPLLGYRVVSVLHNRRSHRPSRAAAKERLVRAVLARSDLVLTHARAGVEIAVAAGPRAAGRVHYLPLPVPPPLRPAAPPLPFPARPIDLLMWGSMRPDKGLDALARLAAERDLGRRHRVLVAGSFPDPRESARLAEAAPGVEVRDGFVAEDELASLMGRARVILFLHDPETVLSSGALMDSLAGDCLLIARRAGAFADAAEAGLVTPFDDPSELPALIAAALATPADERETILRRRRAFAAEHTWERFGATLSELLHNGGPRGSA